MRGKDNCVARFQANQRLKNCSRSGVGGRDNAGNHTERFGHDLGAVGAVGPDHAAGLFIFVFVVNIFGSKMVLDDFVFDNSHSGIFHRHFGQRNPRLVGSRRRRFENGIHLSLGKSCKFLLRAFYPFDEVFQGFSGADNLFRRFRRNLRIFISLIHHYLLKVIFLPKDSTDNW